MELIVEITDCPVTGMKRKVDMCAFIWNRKLNQLSIDCEVYYYQNNSGSYGPAITDSRFQPYRVNTVASNEFYFNPTTKDTISTYQYDQSVHVGYVLEYNYWEPFAYSNVVLATVLSEQILLADSKGKFN